MTDPYLAPDFASVALVTIDTQQDTLDGQPFEVPGTSDALLMALDAEPGRMPPELSLRLQGLLGRLYREWFPRTWRRNPTYAEVVGDFRWWLGVAERWSEPPAKNGRPRRAAREPRADQPKRLLRLLGLRHECTASEFMARWRRFLKAHHPDLNPDQTPDERRDFAEAVALWRR